MGTQDVKKTQDQAAMRRFTRQLIQDMQAFEYMLQEGMFETETRRIGAEQELFLIDSRYQPAMVAEQVMERNTEDRLVTELTRFNLEFNLDPEVYEGTCLSKLEAQIHEMMGYTRALVREVGADIVMCGILPTIHLSDLGLESMAPMPRYFALNDAIMGLREGPAQYQIRGTDELFFQHDNILVEGCNTSFQVHFQVTPEEFPRFYNISQLVAGPCLAAAANSPTLFGKRLWRETRIALFQQAVDTRSSNLYLREMSPRVHFGTRWVQDSVTEIYQEDIARFRVIMMTEYEDPFEVLRQGGVPKLKALQLHNGTVYRWNRACYGITKEVNKPHLRIENRILPSGPTVLDEVANAAFWFGLIGGIADEYGDIAPLMEFDEAKSNFVSAARLGLASELTWLNGDHCPARELILKDLLPLAHRGLTDAGLDADDIDRYLGVIEARISKRVTGADWQLKSLAKMRKEESTRAERLNALVAGMVERQQNGEPIHTWDLAGLRHADTAKRIYGTRVEHFMTTDLFTVHEDELVEFVAVLMDWQRIRHVIVEDTQHRLVGMVTHYSLLRHMTDNGAAKLDEHPRAVKEIMTRNPLSINPEDSTMDAVRLMRAHKVGALPVVQGDQIVGIITEQDFFRIAGHLLDENLPEE